jgi:hypothetical protein
MQKVVKVSSGAYEKALKFSQEQGVTIGSAIEQLMSRGDIQPAQVEPVKEASSSPSVMVYMEDAKPSSAPVRTNPLMGGNDIFALLEKAYSKGQQDILNEQRMELLEEAVLANSDHLNGIQNVLGGLGLGLADHLEQASAKQWQMPKDKATLPKP